MACSLQTFFSAQARMLSEGRISAMAHDYAVPLPVFLKAETRAWTLLDSREAVIEAFWAKHRVLQAADVTRTRARVTAELWTAGSRCQAEVVWFFIGRDGIKLGRTVVDYYLSRRPQGLIVDLLSFRAIAFPSQRDWLLDNAVELHTGAPP